MELKIRIERDKSDVRNAISSIDDMIVLSRDPRTACSADRLERIGARF